MAGNQGTTNGSPKILRVILAPTAAGLACKYEVETGDEGDELAAGGGRVTRLRSNEHRSPGTSPGVTGSRFGAILDDTECHGFNWLGVRATWDMFDHDVSAVGADGEPREPLLGKPKWLVAECDRRGLVVDVTLTRSSERIANLEAHERAVEVIVQALKPHRNWYLDLANECDCPRCLE